MAKNNPSPLLRQKKKTTYTVVYPYPTLQTSCWLRLCICTTVVKLCSWSRVYREIMAVRFVSGILYCMYQEIHHHLLSPRILAVRFVSGFFSLSTLPRYSRPPPLICPHGKQCVVYLYLEWRSSQIFCQPCRAFTREREREEEHEHVKMAIMYCNPRDSVIYERWREFCSSRLPSSSVYLYPTYDTNKKHLMQSERRENSTVVL